MTEIQGCFVIGCLFLIVASQHKEIGFIYLIWNLVAAVWFINGAVQSYAGLIK